MKKHQKKLVIHRETLTRLGQGELREPQGASGASQCVSNCRSDGFPGNCPHSWNGTCTCGQCTEFTLVD